MQVPNNKKIVCITGTVWTGSRSAPRRLLVRDGFVRPTWFTTGRPINDARYRQVSEPRYHLAQVRKQVVAHIRYRNNFIGVMRNDFDAAVDRAEQGVLVVGPPEIAAQLATLFPSTVVFALKGLRTDLSRHLEAVQRSGQLHRIDVDVLAPGAWTDVHTVMAEILVLPKN